MRRVWVLPQEKKKLNSWLKLENLVSIINEFYQGYCKLMNFELEGEKGSKESKRENRGRNTKQNKVRKNKNKHLFTTAV